MNDRNSNVYLHVSLVNIQYFFANLGYLSTTKMEPRESKHIYP